MPLGLQAKTRDFPWVTLAILVVTVVYSALSFDVPQKLRAVHMSDPLALARLQTQKALAAAACSDSDLTTDECSFLQYSMKPEKAETASQFVKRFTAEATAKKFEREAVSRLGDYVLTPWKIVKSTTAQLPEYAAYKTAVDAEDANLAIYAKDHAILTRASFSAWTLLRAQFLHADWGHLLGNMIFFLIFAIPLEQRVGAFSFLLIYFVGGSAGLTIELLLSHETARPVLGASANISAVAAAFMVAFFAFRFRVWVSLFFAFNQIVFVPTWLFLAAFVVVQDLSGALNPASDGVAHLAHLGGFALGLILGYLAIQLRWLPKSFAFPFELKLFLEARSKEKVFSERLQLLRTILFYNAHNDRALVEAWKLVCEAPDLTWEKLPKAARLFLSEHFCALVKELKTADKEQMRQALLIAAGGPNWPWSQLISQDALTRMKVLASELEAGGDKQEARVLLHLVEASLTGLAVSESAEGAGRDVQRRQSVA